MAEKEVIKNKTAEKSGPGRPPKYKSPVQRQSVRAKMMPVYLHRSAKKRRVKYATDAEYRESVRARERERYRGAHPDFTPLPYGQNAGSAAKFAGSVKLPGSRAAVLTLGETATFLSMKKTTLDGWVSSGKFPTGDCVIPSGERGYSARYANALAATLQKALAGKGKFLSSDRRTIDALFKIAR